MKTNPVTPEEGKQDRQYVDHLFSAGFRKGKSAISRLIYEYFALVLELNGQQITVGRHWCEIWRRDGGQLAFEWGDRDSASLQTGKR
ncbi:MAG: hypothetical protein O3B86_17130 [Planctomycetota bacterium]|nr:hypothetical protein [Planctomycetota bacterium]